MSTAMVAERLIAHWIEPPPQLANAAEARVLPHPVAGYVIVAQRALEQGSVAEAVPAYALPREAIAAAIACHHLHGAAIDAHIDANRACFTRQAGVTSVCFDAAAGQQPGGQGGGYGSGPPQWSR